MIVRSRDEHQTYRDPSVIDDEPESEGIRDKVVVTYEIFLWHRNSSKALFGKIFSMLYDVVCAKSC